jgi:hypothetical protein
MLIPSSTTASSSAVGTTAPESLLIRHIRAHVAKGDQAKNKSDQHYIAAGRYLTTLKVSYAPTWQHWEALLRVQVGLSTGRASELMQLADGRKSVQEVRDATTQRVKALRANRNSSLRNEEKEIADEIEEAAHPASAPSPGVALVGIKTGHDPDSIIFALARSTPADRGAAVESLIKGSRQTEFEPVTSAVIDLYQRLSRAGR